jgi:hypothetical protein
MVDTVHGRPVGVLQLERDKMLHDPPTTKKTPWLLWRLARVLRHYDTLLYYYSLTVSLPSAGPTVVLRQAFP